MVSAECSTTSYWIHTWWLERPLKYSELIVVFMKPVWDDSTCSVTVTIRTRVQCCLVNGWLDNCMNKQVYRCLSARVQLWLEHRKVESCFIHPWPKVATIPTCTLTSLATLPPNNKKASIHTKMWEKAEKKNSEKLPKKVLVIIKNKVYDDYQLVYCYTLDHSCFFVWQHPKLCWHNNISEPQWPCEPQSISSTRAQLMLLQQRVEFHRFKLYSRGWGWLSHYDHFRSIETWMVSQ